MRTALAVLLSLGLSGAPTNPPQQEVLVGTSPTLIPRNLFVSSGCEIQNNGPGNIRCSPGSTSTDAGPPLLPDSGQSQVYYGRVVSGSGGTWSTAFPGTEGIWCMVEDGGAAQSARAGTVITEGP
jgi:hypothetical protein